MYLQIGNILHYMNKTFQFSQKFDTVRINFSQMWNQIHMDFPNFNWILPSKYKHVRTFQTTKNLNILHNISKKITTKMLPIHNKIKTCSNWTQLSHFVMYLLLNYRLGKFKVPSKDCTYYRIHYYDMPYF